MSIRPTLMPFKPISRESQTVACAVKDGQHGSAATRIGRGKCGGQTAAEAAVVGGGALRGRAPQAQSLLDYHLRGFIGSPG